MGTGIGGVVAHGQTLFGLGGAAGEIGHIIVVADGPRCGCGNRGCVEALASGPAIVSEANRRVSARFHDGADRTVRREPEQNDARNRGSSGSVQ